MKGTKGNPQQTGGSFFLTGRKQTQSQNQGFCQWGGETGPALEIRRPDRDWPLYHEKWKAVIVEAAAVFSNPPDPTSNYKMVSATIGGGSLYFF